MLAFPDFSKTFILDTDASDTGIGAVLSRLDDNTLSKPERRYYVTRKELLSVITFVHHFCPFLLGNRFLLQTDHGLLTWLSNFKQPEGQVARWIEKLQEYHFDIVHRPGRNTVMPILFIGFHVTSVVMIVMCPTRLLLQQL